jgi:hypothetical protein
MDQPAMRDLDVVILAPVIYFTCEIGYGFVRFVVAFE